MSKLTAFNQIAMLRITRDINQCRTGRLHNIGNPGCQIYITSDNCVVKPFSRSHIAVGNFAKMQRCANFEGQGRGSVTCFNGCQTSLPGIECTAASGA